MPGSSGDPVRFANPFQRITEVGWDTVTHIAFWISIQQIDVDGGSLNLPPEPPVGEMPDRAEDSASGSWVTVVYNEGTFSISISYAPYGLGAYPPGQSIYRKAAGWGLAQEDFELPAGLPDMTASNTWGVLDHTNLVIPPPDNPWVLNSGGDGGDIHIPDQPSLPFAYDVSPRFYRYHNAVYTESPYWARLQPPHVGFGAYITPTDTTLIDKTFAGGGLVAFYKKKAYRACATAVHQLSVVEFRLWVLLKRSESDDPSE